VPVAEAFPAVDAVPAFESQRLPAVPAALPVVDAVAASQPPPLPLFDLRQSVVTDQVAILLISISVGKFSEFFHLKFAHGQNCIT
jgi:hypothetical protein